MSAEQNGMPEKKGTDMLQFHHIGYLVKEIEPSVEAFRRLGYEVEHPPAEDPIRRTYMAFLVKDGARVELVSPMDQQSPIYGLMRHHKNAPYHLCFTADDFDGEINRLEAEGYSMFLEPQPAPCMGWGKVVFLMHPNIGMIELYDGKVNKQTTACSPKEMQNAGDLTI